MNMDPPLGSAANVPPAAILTMEDLLREMQQSNLRLQQLEAKIQQQDVVMGQQGERLEQQEEQINQSKDNLAQAQQELLNLQNAIPAVAAVIPVVQVLPELPVGTVLRNRKETIVVVPDDMIIRPYNGQLTDVEKANLKPPVVLMEDVNTMKPSDWINFARSLVHYYNCGGEKPITAILGERLVGSLASQFSRTVSELVSLSRQLLTYEFLKVWWEKPDEDANRMIEDIKKLELLPAVKGSVEIVVNAFIQEMKKTATGEFTKAMLDVIKSRVFIENWSGDFKTKSYYCYQDFYDHLLLLAKNYDTSNNQTVELKSSKGRQDNKKKGKAGGGGSNTPVEEKKTEKKTDKPKKACQVCGKDDHWAFALDNDYSKPYGPHVNWTCPVVSTKGEDVKKQVWNARSEQYHKRHAKWAAKGADTKK
jgi:hypothetical protein